MYSEREESAMIETGPVLHIRGRRHGDCSLLWMMVFGGCCGDERSGDEVCKKGKSELVVLMWFLYIHVHIYIL